MSPSDGMLSLTVTTPLRQIAESRSTANARFGGRDANLHLFLSHWILIPLGTLLCSGCRSLLLANRVRPCVHKPSAASHIDQRDRRHSHHTALYSSCTFQLLADRLVPCAHMPSAGPDNFARSQQLEPPRETGPLPQTQSTANFSCEFPPHVFLSRQPAPFPFVENAMLPPLAAQQPAEASPANPNSEG